MLVGSCFAAFGEKEGKVVKEIDQALVGSDAGQNSTIRPDNPHAVPPASEPGTSETLHSKRVLDCKKWAAVCKSDVTENCEPQETVPRYQYSSSWEGNIWAPSSWKLLSRSSASKVVNLKSIFVVGDSLARRMTYSFSHFLVGSPDRSLNPTGGNGGHGHFEWKKKEKSLPVEKLDFEWIPRVKTVLAVCSEKNSKFESYDFVVVAIGGHDAIPSDKCSTGHTHTSVFELVGGRYGRRSLHRMDRTAIKNTISCLCRLERPTVIWRMAPYHPFF
jgi:hypothetical protein